MSAYELANSFLQRIYDRAEEYTDRPYVTLTFAQSLDGKIAADDRRQLMLSGDESLIMTHRLRTLHDGILVGIGTALIDDPQLNDTALQMVNVVTARRLDPSILDDCNQPYPVVLDPRLELPVYCKLLKNYQQGVGKQPWVITSIESTRIHKASYDALQLAGARIFTTAERHVDVKRLAGRIALEDVYQILRRNGIRRLMVEGGAKVIRSVIESHWDQLIITIAPILVGNGLTAIDGRKMPTLCDVKYQQLGKDIVLAAKPSK
ncbi:2,5-diamino-6-(ribosylamino)-4(3H)-pyrimidinone 5'-phosphate reductase [Apophysomyces ossiformis]|uniref:2,5-diamino-6-ribosylamino-4(3H)-pyrimidinone 5'-phosphate reductase n=1 Tax=Apophysomyces ossiformis TaxID=679940 RepID=A0A8H7BMX8_9FUNG|nr:2,5-diamino-6-(ribosylamino)-4(3H)-pyrimidinone 5'-phosphate reductase [Apophysomyces ossiformis]